MKIQEREAGQYAHFFSPKPLRLIKQRFLRTQNIVLPMMLMGDFPTLLHIFMCWVLVSKSRPRDKGPTLTKFHILLDQRNTLHKVVSCLRHLDQLETLFYLQDYKLAYQAEADDLQSPPFSPNSVSSRWNTLDEYELHNVQNMMEP